MSLSSVCIWELENCNQLRIEAPSTAFQTDILTVNLTLTSDLDFNPRIAMIMTHTHEKGQGQQSLSSKVETNRRTDGRRDGGNCNTSRANAVGNK